MHPLQDQDLSGLYLQGNLAILYVFLFGFPFLFLLDPSPPRHGEGGAGLFLSGQASRGAGAVGGLHWCNDTIFLTHFSSPGTVLWLCAGAGR